MKRFVGPFIFLFCLTVYLLTLSPGAYPGESSRTIVQYSGLDPFPALAHPVYSLAAQVLAAIPLGALEVRLNVFNAICAALCAWLVYLIGSRIPHDRTFEEVMARFSAPFVQTFSGVVSALLFAFAIPIWIVATRAHTASLDLLLLLSSFYMLIMFGNTGKFGWACAASVVWGLGITEFATCIILAPLFGAAAIYYLWRAGQLRVSTVMALAGCGLGGLTIYLVYAAWYCTTPAYEWRMFKGYGDVLKYILLGQYHMITGGLPKHGWLTVWIVTFVPWLIVFAFRLPGSKSGTRGAWLGSYMLNGVLSVIALLILFNGRLSPWTMTGGRPLLVTPYVFFAMWAGYLAGYWYIAVGHENRRDQEWAKAARRGFRFVFLPLVLIAVLVGAIRNVREADGRSGRLVSRFGDEVIKSLEGRTWLVSNGILDDQLVLAARRQGVDLHVLNAVPFGSANAYTRYLATLFDEPRLKSMARIGLAPLMGELMATREDTPDLFAALAQSDMWYSGGFVPVPNKTLFLGVRADDPKPDPSQELAKHEAFWKNYGEPLRKLAKNDDVTPAAPWNRWIVSHISRVANNFGVYLEETGRSDDAFVAYREALLLETNNISALMNMHALAKREERPDFQRLDDELNKYLKSMQATGRRMWSVSQVYGYIRSAEFYASRGWAWAMSGKPNLAASDMKYATELSGKQDSLQLSLGRMYFTQDMPEESGAAYLSVLKKDPDDQNALLGMLMVSMRKNDLDAARGYVSRLEDLKAPPLILEMHKATIEALSGNYAEAKDLLAHVVQDQPDHVQAWAALASVALELDDKATLDAALEKLRVMRVLPSSIRLTIAHIALVRNDRPSARHQLNELLRFQPGHVQALEMILRLDIYDRKRDLAEQHVQQLVSADRKNAFGNFFLGILQASHGDDALAEASFRVSLSQQRTTETLNELSWLLAKRGSYDEARTLVKESLAMVSENGSAWDTLGYIHLNTGNIEEAERAFQEALRLKPGDPEVVLHMALVMEKKGMNQESLRLADSLLSRPAEMDKETYDEVREIAKRLRGST